MKIRRLQRHDYDQVMDLMIKFAQETGVKDVCHDTYDKKYAERILAFCEHTGVSLVAEDNQRIVGMILSLRDKELWIPTVIRLKEVAWWVDPEYRHRSVGAKLFKLYRDGADQLLKEGKITGYTITKLSTSPDFDYERRGFKPLETTWMVGA